jgi:hypothetical protein
VRVERGPSRDALDGGGALMICATCTVPCKPGEQMRHAGIAGTGELTGYSKVLSLTEDDGPGVPEESRGAYLHAPPALDDSRTCAPSGGHGWVCLSSVTYRHSGVRRSAIAQVAARLP